MSKLKKHIEEAANDEDAGPLFTLGKLCLELSRVSSGVVLAFLFAVCLGWFPATNFSFRTLAVVQALSFGLAVTAVYLNGRATQIVLHR